MDGWKSYTNWNLVKEGMSVSQLEEILGQPSSKGTGGKGPIWYYEGKVQGSGNVSGNIKFYQRRVWEINTPVFNVPIFSATKSISNGWKSYTNWNLVKEGMSVSQLEEILGQPSSKGADGMGPIWYYEGNVQESGKVSGNIKFYQRRVWEINTPVFNVPIFSATKSISNGWKSYTNWNLVKEGMSVSQLEEILGQPSSKGAGSMGSIWYYEGNVQELGKVSGNIKFYQNRVWDINKPVF